MAKSQAKELARSQAIGCTIKSLPAEHAIAAAETAKRINPANAPLLPKLYEVARNLMGRKAEPVILPQHIAAATTKYWGPDGVRLTVGFMERTTQALADKILSFANLWGKTANVQFTYTANVNDAQVRISRGPGGYYSYLGVDILHIPKNQQTMNLEAFVLSTPDSEYLRVVTHEFGHTLSAVHEHLRAALVAQLDEAKTLAYFERTQGWSEQEVRDQVLTPVPEASLFKPTPVDQDSIMCYVLPAQITKNGQPIRGGTAINARDAAYMATLYPLAITPPPPPPPPPVGTYRYLVSSAAPVTFAQQ